MPNPSAVLSDVEICNWALFRMGAPVQISSFQDGTVASNGCQLWYPRVRDQLLRDFPWPFARQYVQLTQVAGPPITTTMATPAWVYSYVYPPDAILVRRLMTPPPTTISGALPPPTPVANQAVMTGPQTWRRADGNTRPPPFEIMAGTPTRLICTDLFGAFAEYTQAVTDPTQYDPAFASLLAWRLGRELAMSIAISDERRKACEMERDREEKRAQAMALNEGQGDTPWMSYQSQFVRARWGR